MNFDEWHDQAGRAAYMAFSNGLPLVPWQHIAEDARERWRGVGRAVLGEGKIEVRPSAELAEQATREENDRLIKIARERAEDAQSYRDAADELRSQLAGLRRAYDHERLQAEKYMRRAIEWRDAALNGTAVTVACTGCGSCDYCAEFPRGLCGNRDNHAPHLHDSAGLGRFWCDADQSKRLPFAMERKADQSGGGK